MKLEEAEVNHQTNSFDQLVYACTSEKGAIASIFHTELLKGSS